MMEQEYHEMVLEAVHSSGAEEWFCPTCGRRFLMQWPPAYNKVILEAGDESAIHSGGKGGLNSLSSNPGTHDESVVADESIDLALWEDLLEKMDFEALWNK